ncbi:sporulation membrane protein YtaF [Halalkalibacterium halodurans]|jgi:putative sporulation protein YtaF|uniref:BH3151 protein n=3 Tax=Halalkalibacterium halodurans TaxID=86665 RepID=Q9K856_HALH5|nr:sporulation membrane protein YtaF [Halalkalibacterium halodurans]MDY7223684.1 sporulation membrane protein YtaF [Halalkalibacterium halodurans]MDY7242905.1 sporulation membrane protein YtaF [Halalkalibacterium halodurans]MED3645648.1 sporulation membrane protein YtaF [Halalkalibacterium halodurans]MED4082133.1 sporulation membrane protein YtaF [Halalkalibacterium halodurans]MED4084289.1 sporulation membrane protein YtaF [Halalkalibacterium halodurans]
MIHLVSLLALAFAVSLDSFGVGLTYGLRKMKIPFKSLLFIAGCSAVSILIAMGFGMTIQQYLSPAIAESLGGIILILIGCWALYQAFRPAKNGHKTKDDHVILNFEIKMLGVVIRILRKPMVADFDNSGAITGREAVILGIALSLDAFGAGIGAALIGFHPLYMAVSVAVMSALFVSLGMKSGYRFADSYWIKRFSFIPGLLLVLIGVFNLMM